MTFNYLIRLVAIFFATAIGTGIIIKAVIKVSLLKHLFDEPSEDRKIHISRTPNLGGVGIYAAFLFAICVCIPENQIEYFRYFVAGSLILVAIGLKDDLVGLSPTKKLIAQICSAIIIAQMTNIRITSFYGFMGIYDLAFPVSVLVTVLVSIFIYNAMNLIDGIDGLAAGIGFLASATYAYFFFRMGDYGDCLLAVGFCGALMGFLYFNISPAKIFMGDTGSLLVGFMLAIFSIRFIELNKFNPITNKTPYFIAAPAISISILIIPIFDTLRVFILRVLRGTSPFAADRNHLHHRFLDMKFTHMQTTFVLICTNILFISLSIVLQDIGNAQLIAFVLLLAVLVNTIFWNLSKKQTVVETSASSVDEAGKLAKSDKKKDKNFEEISVKLKLPLN